MGAFCRFWVFGFLVHVIFSSSGSPINEAITSTNTISPILQSIHDKWGIEKKPPFKLDKTKFDLVFVCLLEKCERLYDENRRLMKEKCDLANDRNFLLSILNFAEYIENLFLECWPQWAEIRRNREHTKHCWKILFLNLENDRIRLLKRNLVTLDITEETFIDLMKKLEMLRCSGTHVRIQLKRRNETYQQLLSQFPVKIKSILQAIICDIINCPAESDRLNNDTEKKIKDAIIEQRKSFRLLKIPHLDINEDDRDLEWGIEKLIPKPKPVAYIAINDHTDNTGYILFSNFDDAYTVWKNRGSTSFRLPCKDSMSIIHASNGPFSNKGGYVMVEAAESDLISIQEQIMKFVDLVPTKIYKTSKPIAKIVTIASKAEKIAVTSFLFTYRSAETAMEAYERYKNCFKSRHPYITTSIIPLMLD